jgi:hypothetical protein
VGFMMWCLGKVIAELEEAMLREFGAMAEW